MPENYCLAVVRDGHWEPCVDGGIGRAQRALMAVVRANQYTDTETLRRRLENKLAGRSRRR